jgi:hypothetical protein
MARSQSQVKLKGSRRDHRQCHAHSFMITRLWFLDAQASHNCSLLYRYYHRNAMDSDINIDRPRLNKQNLHRYILGFGFHHTYSLGKVGYHDSNFSAEYTQDRSPKIHVVDAQRYHVHIDLHQPYKNKKKYPWRHGPLTSEYQHYSQYVVTIIHQLIQLLPKPPPPSPLTNTPHPLPHRLNYPTPTTSIASVQRHLSKHPVHHTRKRMMMMMIPV